MEISKNQPKSTTKMTPEIPQMPTSFDRKINFI